MTPKFDALFKALNECMCAGDILGDNSTKPYDTSDPRIPQNFGTYTRKGKKKKKTIKEKKDWENVPKPDEMKELMNQCSLGKDKDGYFAYTHRARTNSYKSPTDIPKSKIEFINSTS